MRDRTKMRAASQSFRLLWMKSLQSGGLPAVAQRAMGMVMEIGEPDFTGIYRWFEGVPILRHWIGDRQAKQLMAEGFQVNQKPFESTLKVMRDDIKFDKLGGYKPAIMRMANELKLTPYRRMLEVLKDGFAGATYLGFDGKPLFSNTHGFGDNDLGTIALTHANLDTAIVAMRNHADVETSDSLLIEPTHLWYHQDLAPTAESILDLDFVASFGTSTTHTDTSIRNKHHNKLQHLPLPLGAGKTTWWGLAALEQGNPLRPILWQYDPKGGDFVALDRAEDERNFMRRELLYGTELWGAEAVGFPMYISGSQGS